MSTVRSRLPLADARAIADELVDLLASSCEQLVIAGSIRRQSEDVGDIDLVAVPKLAPLPDMFGGTIGHVNVLNSRLDDLCGQQLLHQARRDDGALVGWGPRLRHAVYGGLRVQVQSVDDPDRFGMWLIIRTGPSDYSHAFVTPRSQTAVLRDKNGDVVGTRHGLLPPGFEVRDGFRLYRGGGLVPTPTERSVYDALGLPYLAPEQRR